MATKQKDMSERILDVAEALVQTRGFNAFSYADIAKALSVTKASLHYHYATKAALGQRLIARYTEGFLAALADVDARAQNGRDALLAYVQIYADVLAKNRMCLCGMLAADYATLPKPMRDGVRAFFDANEAWLVRTLARGRAQGVLSFAGDDVENARALAGALEGAMLIARSYGEPQRFTRSATLSIEALSAPAKRQKATKRA